MKFLIWSFFFTDSYVRYTHSFYLSQDFTLCIWLSLCASITWNFAFVRFRSLAVGTKTGYKLYSLGSVDKLECIFESGKIYVKCLRHRSSCNFWPEIRLTKSAVIRSLYFHVLELEIRQAELIQTQTTEFDFCALLFRVHLYLDCLTGLFQLGVAEFKAHCTLRVRACHCTMQNTKHPESYSFEHHWDWGRPMHLKNSAVVMYAVYIIRHLACCWH